LIATLRCFFSNHLTTFSAGCFLLRLSKQGGASLQALTSAAKIERLTKQLNRALRKIKTPYDSNYSMKISHPHPTVGGLEQRWTYEQSPLPGTKSHC